MAHQASGAGNVAAPMGGGRGWPQQPRPEARKSPPRDDVGAIGCLQQALWTGETRSSPPAGRASCRATRPPSSANTFNIIHFGQWKLQYECFNITNIIITCSEFCCQIKLNQKGSRMNLHHDPNILSGTRISLYGNTYLGYHLTMGDFRIPRTTFIGLTCELCTKMALRKCSHM